jgi:hypothetical protein
MLLAAIGNYHRNWRQDAALTGTLEARRYVAAAILAASECGFQPRLFLEAYV